MSTPDYDRIIAMDNATLDSMRRKTIEQQEWRTVIVGLPIIRKLLNGEDVTLESFKVNLIPDDVLFNNRPAVEQARGAETGEEHK
jgi:hypothetical protein